MQVGLGALVGGVVLGAVLAPALLPALALVADYPGRDYVLPLDALGPLRCLARHVAAALQVHSIALVAATAIELHRMGGIELPGDLLGLIEGAGGGGFGYGGEQQAKQQDRADHQASYSRYCVRGND
ncbi:hypothetical protein D9M71_551690 [compost metagenome]